MNENFPSQKIPQSELFVIIYHEFPFYAFCFSHFEFDLRFESDGEPKALKCNLNFAHIL